MWLVAVGFTIGQFFTTVDLLPSEARLASGAAAIAAVLAIIGTFRLAGWARS